MPAREFNRILGRLDLSLLAAAELLGVNDRTLRRWPSGAYPITPPAARFLCFLARTGRSPAGVMKLIS
jgi:DNA-binding transcriptional regulator YiaG